MSVQTPDHTQLQPTTTPVSINAVTKSTSESANDGQLETVIERSRPAEPSEKIPYDESSRQLSDDSHNLANRCTDKPRELHERFQDIKKAWRSIKEAIKVAGKRVWKRRRSSNLDSPKVYRDTTSATTPPDYHGPNDPGKHRCSSRGYENFIRSLQIVVGGEEDNFKGSFDTQSRYNYVHPDVAEAHFKSLIRTFAPHEVVPASAVDGSKFTARRYFDARWSVKDSIKFQNVEISPAMHYTSRFLIPEKMTGHAVIIGIDTINHCGRDDVSVAAMAYPKPKTLQGAAKKKALLEQREKERALAEKIKAWKNSQGGQQSGSPPAPTPGNSQAA